LVRHEVSAVRAAVVDLLHRGDLLAQGTKDADPYVRRRALIRWAQLDPEAARPTLTRAVRDDDAGVRRAACAVLAGQSEEAGISALLAAADDTDASVRTAAMRALPKELGRRLVPVIHGDARQRRAVVHALRAERRRFRRQETASNAR
ncbi:MAG: HEAT repeat domain-containing protein, partial [Myxococcota bacterium]